MSKVILEKQRWVNDVFLISWKENHCKGAVSKYEGAGVESNGLGHDFLRSKNWGIKPILFLEPKCMKFLPNIIGVKLFLTSFLTT